MIIFFSVPAGLFIMLRQRGGGGGALYFIIERQRGAPRALSFIIGHQIGAQRALSFIIVRQRRRRGRLYGDLLSQKSVNCNSVTYLKKTWGGPLCILGVVIWA